MKLRKFIIKNKRDRTIRSRFRFPPVFFDFKRILLLYAVFLPVIFQCFLLSADAQKIAVLIPEKTGQTQKFSVEFENSLKQKFNVLDNGLSEAAFRSGVYENPFNLSVFEAKDIGAAIGSEYFFLVKSATLRRSAYKREEFYESFAAVYVVSSRTGRLVFWKLQSFEAEKPFEAEKLLFASTGNLASEIFDKLKLVTKAELNEKPNEKIEQVPAENAEDAKNLRPPLPYKRLKPEYTRLAYIYDVKATVDISIDLNENGEILRTEIVRWAGYDLDESVTNTVRKMNWRPAERNGKTLPMRVLLRYNFKKIEKED